MDDHKAILDAVRARPKDDARWLVYADWLDDRSDPRGEYIRLVLSLAVRPDPISRRRLNAVRPTLPRDWLAVVEQPALLRANSTPYRPHWPAIGLGEIRPAESTYAGRPYDWLPPVPVDWLVRFDDWYARTAARIQSGVRNRDEEEESKIPRLSVAANDFGLKLPDHFAAFFQDKSHPRLIPSVTDCFFNLPERIVPAPDCPEAGLVRFYSDSQGCLHWYLYLTPEGDECVVSSAANVGGDWVLRQLSVRDGWRYEDEDDLTGQRFNFCAPSFAEFITRTWLESMAWYSRNCQFASAAEIYRARLPEVQRYLDRCRIAADWGNAIQ